MASKKTPVAVQKKSGGGCLWKMLLLLVLGTVFVMFSPTLLDFNPRIPETPFPEKLEGPYEENTLLDKAELQFEGRLVGPESLVFLNGSIYTGAHDGWVYRITGNKLEPLVRIGRECDLPWEEEDCGRPLGLRLGKEDKLYIVDAYYGIYSYDLKSGSLSRVFSIGEVVEGEEVTFPDDMDIDESGVIYFSDASTKWSLAYVFYLIGDYDTSGRIIKYDPKTKTAEVLVNGLRFPNGVQLTHDRQSLLYVEYTTRTVFRYHLKGPKKGKQEVFVEDLPGECDNIRPSSRGGYWLALSTARNASSPTITDFLGQYPILLRSLARLQHMVGSLLDTFLNMMSPIGQEYRKIAYDLKMSRGLLPFIKQHSMIVEVDKNGHVLRTLQSPTGKVGLLSEVGEHNGFLYLASYCNPYLGRMKA